MRPTDMILTKPVEEALKEAMLDLREALAFSARSEKPFVSKHIADTLMKIETLIDISSVVSSVEDASK